MGDTANNGGLVKKLLFPASSSGANDAFRNPGNAFAVQPSPGRVSPTKPTVRGNHHHNNHNKASAPPRFFSSTHPSTGDANSHHPPPLQTPSRVPNSPPLLQRKPVTPSSEMAAAAKQLPMDLSRSDSVELKPSKEAAKLEGSDDDDTLSFLKDFRRQAGSRNSSRDMEEAKTEVHDNTTAAQHQRSKHNHHQQQQQAEPEERCQESAEAQSTGLDPTAHTAAEEEEKATNEQPSASNDDGEDDEHNVEDESMIPGIQSYPSYYDNPYINPYGSALKPNDLFRTKEQDTTIDSDINSNCSEMGTVIGAPASLMADRFAEVDAMEREGKLAMQNDDNADDSSSFDEAMDPALANYKAFRIHDHEDAQSQEEEEEEEEEEQFSKDESTVDPFQTPSQVTNPDGGEGRTNRSASEVLSTASQMGTVVGISEARERLADIEAMAAKIARDSYDEDDNNGDESEHEADNSSHVEEEPPTQQQEVPHQQIKQARLDCHSLPIREPHPDEAALSVVDSEIDQLIRSASESSGNSNIKSFNSNNSADVFRAPSGGSLADRQQQSNNNNNNNKQQLNYAQDDDDEELDAINARDPSAVSTTSSERERRKKRPSSSLQRALTRAHKQIQDNESDGQHQRTHEQHKEDEKEEKEEDLRGLHEPHQEYRFEVPTEKEQSDNEDTNVDSSHLASVGSPGRSLASTIQRIGTKLAKRPSPSSSNAIQNQYLFDIGDEDDTGTPRGIHSMSESATDLTSVMSKDSLEGIHNNVQHPFLSKIREAAPKSPSRGTCAKTSQKDHVDFGTPSLLKSPRASARLMADFRRESSSSSVGTGKVEGQRVSARSGRAPNILKSSSFASIGHGPTPLAANGRNRVEPQPLRFARGCLSFDTTTDDVYDYEYSRDSHASKGGQWLKSAQSYDSRQHHLLATPTRPASSAFRRRFKVAANDKSSTQALYRSSQSWDVSSSMWSAAAGAGTSDRERDDKLKSGALTLDAGAFRVAPYVRQQQQQTHPHAHGYNNSMGSRLVSGERQQRLKLMSDSPRQRADNLELLQTPQRIEIEREDALNLLACLCERGVALNPADEGEAKAIPEADEDGHDSKSKSRDAANPTEKNGCRDASREDGGRKFATGRSTAGDLEQETVDEAVDVLRELSRAKHRSGDDATASIDHTMRMEVLDELLQSHTYALEMKRAALSASAWLRSIGHTENRQEEHTLARHSVSEQEAGEREQSNRSASATADNAELLALKALLHQAQIDAHEKDQVAQQLNDELSKCRAEIGRLKSASRTKTSFTSPNRSILDDDSASEGLPNTDSGTKKESEAMIADESIVDLDSSLFATEGEVVRESDQPELAELKMYKSALHDANAIIKKLHGELQEAKPDDEVHARDPPLIEVSQKAFSVALVDESTSNIEKSSNSFSDQHADNRLVNVRMLNGENFVTDWEPAEHLPPPPDHGLRSPIVNALLQQWSADEALHGSLLAWMENVMTAGADPANVPPLTLSSLDHQVRDGMMMHVLPLLLRRSDILLDVKTRAHRKTTYDLAVNVTSNPLVGSVRNMESMSSRQSAASGVGSVTHSAITTQVRNGDPNANDVHEVGSTAASYATFSTGYSTLMPRRPSDEKCESPQPQQAGLMSALGGALGGLLSRRKPNASFYDAGLANSYDMGSAVGAAGPGPMDLPPHDASLEAKDQEPYHRLVSAPPGRIGVSFVEFRGHAMVSDVSQDSPLLGWIFPSDILIAIDEVPVSGMRLKDIVKVLQGRSGRQRAMRVISSHAMNSFTLNTTHSPSS